MTQPAAGDHYHLEQSDRQYSPVESPDRPMKRRAMMAAIKVAPSSGRLVCLDDGPRRFQRVSDTLAADQNAFDNDKWRCPPVRPGRSPGRQGDALQFDAQQAHKDKAAQHRQLRIRLISGCRAGP